MAWFEPTHHTVEPASRFFQRRFADMDWSIVTPGVTAHCLNGKVSFQLDALRPDLPEDAYEDLWTTYYSNIFNPARLKVNAMTSEMPKSVSVLTTVHPSYVLCAKGEAAQGQARDILFRDLSKAATYAAFLPPV